MPPRSARHRGGSQRWLIIPFVITILVLLVDASMHARSQQPEATLNSQAWVDKVLPDIAQSSAQGLEIAQVSTNRLTVGGRTVARELSNIATEAEATYKAARAAPAPAQVAPAAGLLEACLLARQQGAAQMASAVQGLVRGDLGPPAVAQMTAAVADFEVSDSAYQLFSKDMPKLGVRMPPSKWAPSGGQYRPSALTAFSQRLLADVAKSPPQVVYIDAVSTVPGALSTQGGVEVLSPTSTVSVTVVVANRGQSDEDGVLVMAGIKPAVGAPEQKMSETVGLSPGQAEAVTLTGLRVRLSTPTLLTVTAKGPGDAAAATKQLRVEVPGPDFAGVTTTTGAASTTTSVTTTTVAQ